MKLNDNDMARADFWATFYAAKDAVRKAVGINNGADDKTAKAMADAVDVLCKAMLLAKSQKADA
jgi:phosphopantetheinyl transferase (holo-ACP synthase)